MIFRRNLFIDIFPYLLLFIITAIALYITKPVALQIRWNDETLYYTVAQNIVRHFDFNSNHYLASSIIQKGYPTKDTHLPGYPVILAFGFLIGGINEATPFFVNYLLLILTIFLIFTVSRVIANQYVGFGASLIYLIYPYTLVLTHSVMTEISASAVIMVVVTLLFVEKKSFLKGILLSLAIALAYLIKPFLLTLFPASITFLWIEKNKNYKKTLFSLLFAFVLLFLTLIIPLSQNQEIYPYAATRIFSQSNYADMVRMMGENFIFNCSLIVNFKQFPVYGKITISMLLLWSIIFVVLVMGIYQYKFHKLPTYISYMNLCIFTIMSFMPAFLAIFLLYQYIDMGIRGLAVFSPLIAILSVAGLWQLNYQLKTQKIVTIGLVICLYLSYSSFVTFHKLKNLQRRQSQRLYAYSSRLEKVISKLSIQPQIVVSEKNFYLAIANYPTQVIWQLPQTLQELQQVDKKVGIDLIELKNSDPIFQENLQVYGNINLLDNRYILKYQNQGFYYYLQK